VYSNVIPIFIVLGIVLICALGGLGYLGFSAFKAWILDNIEKTKGILNK
jgi:hypothetical protein